MSSQGGGEDALVILSLTARDLLYGAAEPLADPRSTDLAFAVLGANEDWVVFPDSGGGHSFEVFVRVYHD